MAHCAWALHFWVVLRATWCLARVASIPSKLSSDSYQCEISLTRPCNWLPAELTILTCKFLLFFKSDWIAEVSNHWDGSAPKSKKTYLYRGEKVFFSRSPLHKNYIDKKWVIQRKMKARLVWLAGMGWSRDVSITRPWLKYSAEAVCPSHCPCIDWIAYLGGKHVVLLNEIGRPAGFIISHIIITLLTIASET